MPVIIRLAQVALAFCIVGWVLRRSYQSDPDVLRALLSARKGWVDLIAAWALAMTAFCVATMRWYLLVRALELPLRVSETFRLAFLGSLFNYVSFGNLGGDAFKAVFVARRTSGRRLRAVSTIVVDRILGLYALLLVVTVGSFLSSDLPGSDDARRIVQSGRLLALSATVGGAAVLWLPSALSARWFGGVPVLRRLVDKCVDAFQAYRRQRRTLLLCTVLSVLVHILVCIAVFLTARGLSGNAPPLRLQMVIVPSAMAAGALPVSPAGLGTFELALEFLFRVVADSVPGHGVMTALAYRAIGLVNVAVGVGIYSMYRREVKQVIQIAEDPAAPTLGDEGAQRVAESSTSTLAETVKSHIPL